MFDLLIRRELRNHLRDPQRLFQPPLFFVLTICLFPIALGMDANLLLQSAPAALWVPLMLSCLLAAANLFEEDYANGMLAQDAIHLPDLWLLVLAKVLAVWLSFFLPFAILLPLTGTILGIALTRLPEIAAQTALGSFSFSMIATLGAVLTLNRRGNTFLQFLIVIPFYLPLLMIASNATRNLLIGLPVSGERALLGAFALFSALSVIPFSSLALRTQSLD